MRILHLANHCERGGNVQLAVDLACCQAREGHHVVFASAGGRFEALLNAQGVRHLELPQSLRSPAVAARSLARLVNICREVKPDLIHAHMMSGALHGFVASRFLRVPLVTTMHNSFDPHSWLMLCADRIVAVSRAEHARLRRRYPRTRKLDVVVNGTVGSPRLALSAGVPLRFLRRPCISTVCGLDPRKGVDVLIEAFRLVAQAAEDWHLEIVGDGPERERLEVQARRTGVASRIHFHGEVENPFPLLRQSDIFVLASHVEPFGLSLLEAREAGCAVIGTCVGGISEQLDDGKYGLLVPPGRADLLGEALLTLMRDPQELRRARADARLHLDSFTVERMSSDYLSVYEAARREAGASLERRQ